MKLLWRKLRQIEVRNDINQNKMEFYSVLIPTILSTDIFKRNIEIKKIIDLFKVEKKFGEYLYSNRTALLARIIREIDKNNEEDLNHNIECFKESTLALIEEKGLIDPSEVTKFINKYSRNKG